MAAMSLWSFASAPALPSRRPPSLSTRSIPSPWSLSRSPSPPPSSYATSDMVEDSSSLPIDVVADVKTEKIVVLGGNGFVGSAICKAAALKGIEVVSISRSGRPSYTDSWVDQVSWIAGIPLYSMF
ncbi:hypothetical protein BHE74_00044875 [Ensete ventricosum]|nr:hypothetical protein BHE74_00044875 [Ensete ventricosum]